jgi:hypothetical protein
VMPKLRVAAPAGKDSAIANSSAGRQVRMRPPFSRLG